jgi:cell filamentation protein
MGESKQSLDSLKPKEVKMKRGKRYVEAAKLVDSTKTYDAKEAFELIEKMPKTTFDEIVDKYVEMNVAHPFMEGNGRSTRIWLDMIFKKRLGQCVDWSKIGKRAYLDAMIESQNDSTKIKELLSLAMTDKINDRETFMKGIDYSYYYEQND